MAENFNGIRKKSPLLNCRLSKDIRKYDSYDHDRYYKFKRTLWWLPYDRLFTQRVFFSIKNSSDYLTKKRALIADEILFHIIESIFHHDLLTSSEWAEKYHISESTVLRYLRKVQPIFSSYRLEIQTNPVSFVGEEINIRKFFHDFYYESEITGHTIFPPIAIQNITASAFSKCYQLNQHTCSFGEFNYYLYIT